MEFDYKKYLGPDWKPNKNLKPSTIISNHQSWMDIMVHSTRQPPSHVAKVTTKKVPFLGYVSQAVGCLYTDRSGQKNVNQGLTDVISERQQMCEKGLYPPLIIYPEGGTSNGKQLLKFKRGAFMGLHSIQPIVIKYNSPFFDAENCILSYNVHGGLACSNIWQRINVKTLPVFVPNEYFWQHH